MMKNSFAQLLSAFLLLGTGSVWADTIAFNDPCLPGNGCSAYGSTGNPLYYGGNGDGTPPTEGADIVGFESDFDILSLTVAHSGDDMQVSILTRFVEPDAPGPDDIIYGDLLLSTTGWKPYGAAPFDQDTATTSLTNWNYVIGTHTQKLYQIASNTFLDLSDTAPHGSDPANFCSNQYVRLKNGKGTEVTTANVTIDPFVQLPDVTGGPSPVLGALLTYNFKLSDLDFPNLNEGGTQLTLRWAMTCANDIVEAQVDTVPEPESLSLFVGGLYALLRARHSGKTRKKA